MYHYVDKKKIYLHIKYCVNKISIDDFIIIITRILNKFN